MYKEKKGLMFMKEKIVDFILSFIVVLSVLAMVSFITGAVIQVIFSIISGNFLLVGLPAVFIIIFGIYVLFVSIKEIFK